MLVPINLTGGSFKHKSVMLTQQVTRNFWPQLTGTTKARSEYTLQSFYGLQLFKEQAGINDRGVIVNQNKLYRVLDTTLYSVSATGIHTSLGTIPGSNRCFLKAMGSQIIIANGSGLVFVYNPDAVLPTLPLSQNFSPNLGLPRSVSVLNNQAIYDNGSGQSFDVSDVGKPSDISGLNNASAESFSDELLITYAWRETLYLAGRDTIELWYNSGQGNPPFDKVQGAVINMGLDAIYSMADMPDFIFFLGNDKQFHSLTPGTSAVDTVISNPAMAKQIAKYLITSDCIGHTMQLGGQWFYVATFPTENITWVYPVGGEWFEWGSGTKDRIRANSYAKVFNKHIVTDFSNGNLYELSPDVYTDAGLPIIRTRDSAPIHSGMFGADNKEFEINSLEIVLETGTGIIDGQGSNPFIAVSISRDGGKSFGTERLGRVGKMGERVTVRFNSLGRIKNSCVIRIRVSDPVYWSIFNANMDVEICI